MDMRTCAPRLILMGATILLAAGHLGAQEFEAHPRAGLWGSFGIGAAPLGCFECGDNLTWGYSGSLKLGGTISRSVLVGGAINSWRKSDVTWGITSLLVQVYPSATSGFWLNTGAGLSTSFSDALANVEYSAGFVVGAGYDARLGAGAGWSLTPFLNGMVATERGTPYAIQFGLAITGH